MPVGVVFMQHGLWGRAVDLINLAEGLRNKYECHCLLLDNNVGKTTQGILKCGRRARDVIKDVCDNLDAGSKVSFVGHSLGGLILLQALNLILHVTTC